MKKLFMNLDVSCLDNNFGYALISEDEEKEVLKEFEDIDSYLSQRSMDCWQKIPITKKNIEVLRKIADVMDSELNNTIGDDFGGCPHCGKNDGYLNIGRGHWFYCKEHKTKWLRGNNLFFSWRNQSEEDWKRNFNTLEDYKVVEPVLAKVV